MVSIIIPTLNEEKYLPRLLECLSNQTFKDFEVIVADANSKDRTKEIALNYGAKVVEGGIQAIGRNNGAKKALGDIFIFIDSDVTFSSNFLYNLIKEFKLKDLDFAIPKFNTEHDLFRFRIFLKWSNLYKDIMKSTRYPDGTGQLVIVKKDSFFSIGGFPNFRVAEDTVLFWKAAKGRAFKVGLISEKFTSSTRRLEKNGLLWTMFVWGLIGIGIGIGIIGKDKFQSFATNLYGGIKGFR